MADVSSAQERAVGLYLEDLTVGQAFSSGEYLVDAEQIVAFAREFDPQPFHLDPEAAKRTFFRGHAASGWHTMAITMRLLVQSVPLAQGILGVNGMVSWPRATRPGDRLHVKCEIVTITPSRSRPDRAIVEMHAQTFNQEGEVVLDLVTKILVFKRKA